MRPLSGCERVLACHGGGVRRFDPVGRSGYYPADAMSHMSRSLHDALDETLVFIGRALDRIRAGDGAESELHDVRAYLVNILELIERDPGIEVASDDLYQVAAVLAGGTDQGTRMARLLNEAFLRFRDRLGLAQPSERAKQMGLSDDHR